MVAAISGDLDGRTAPEAQLAVLQALEHASDLLLDLTQTRYLSSAGLRMLLVVHRESASRQKRVVLVGVRSEIEEVMNATGFLRFFTLAGSVDAALTLLNR
jgi:anti-sigma B factor antagonist